MHYNSLAWCLLLALLKYYFLCPQWHPEMTAASSQQPGYLSTQWFALSVLLCISDVLCCTSRPNLDVPHWASPYSTKSWRRVIPFGNPCFVSLQAMSAVAQGCSISAIGHSSTEAAGRVSCTRSFKSLHSHHQCCKRSFSALHSAGSMRWENAPQQRAQQGFVDCCLQQKAVICFGTQPQISMVTSSANMPEVLHPF